MKPKNFFKICCFMAGFVCFEAGMLWYQGFTGLAVFGLIAAIFTVYVGSIPYRRGYRDHED